MNGLGQARLVALCTFGPTGAVRQAQVGAAVDDGRRGVLDVDVDDGGLVVLRAGDRPAA